MIKPSKIDDARARRLALGFLLFLFVFEIYVVGANYSSFFVHLWDTETYFFSVIAYVAIAAAFFIFFLFIAFAISSSWPYRIAYLLIFAFSVLVEYAYQKALGRFSDKVDIETAIATTGDQKAAAVSMYANLYAVVPIIILLVLFLYFRPEKPRGLRSFLIVNGLLIVSFGLFPFVVDQKFPVISTSAFYRTNTDFLINGPVTSGKWGSQVTGVELTRRQVKQPDLPADFRPGNNVILVIDESVRGDHFSLNGYGRETTPLLDRLKREKVLHNWGIAAAASTGSRFTYSALVSGLKPDDFPDKTEFKVNTFPTIFQYAKAMGYKTYFFDCQMTGYWGGIADDKNYIDDWLGVIDITEGKSFEPWQLDEMAAKKVKNLIYASTGNFIVVFKRGSHIPYHSNFPPGQEMWIPSYVSENKFDIPGADRLAEVTNAYDNSLRYHVNTFFTALIDDYSRIPNNSVIIYTGDHGQTLFVNGRSSHGGNTKEEATVPLFIIGGIDPSIDTAYRASHQNIFPTILDLISFPVEFRDYSNVPSLLEARAADSRPRFFNPDLGHKVPFD